MQREFSHFNYFNCTALQAAKELDARSKEWIQVENGYHGQLSEKDAEIRHLLLQVELASQSNVEEVLTVAALSTLFAENYLTF